MLRDLHGRTVFWGNAGQRASKHQEAQTCGYLGIHGDEFDSQKDMALAAGGAVIALGLTAVFSVNAKAEYPQGG